MNNIVSIEEADIESGEVPKFDSLLNGTTDNLIRVPALNNAPQSKLSALDNKMKIRQARKFTKRALIAVGIGSASAAAIGASPIPFADWILLVPIQLGMMIAICASFELRVDKCILVFLLAGSVGTEVLELVLVGCLLLH